MSNKFYSAMTRRRVLAGAGLIVGASLRPHLAWGAMLSREDALDDTSVPSGTLADDPMRPQFHLLPARNWMNDPNGPIYFDGKYHMFFQYNPLGAIWGDMSWNHAVSSDMLHWSHLPVALTPTPDGPDAYGVFSGSALQVGKRVYAVYTGTRLSTPELATIRDGSDKHIQESQCLAWSDDPDLVRWSKAPQPIVPLPPPGMKITGFRDPSAWRQNGWYYMTVGSGVAAVGGCVLLYRSHDLHTWEYLHPLTSGACAQPPTANPCGDGEMWECPEFFALDGKHLLIYSTLGKVFWQSGTLDETTMKFEGHKTGVIDLGAFYAPKTQLDAQGRRILWGWLPERRPESAMLKAGWSGMMSLPRVMSLDADGTLRLRILPQTDSLRAGMIPTKDQKSMLAQCSGEALCEGVKGKSFDLLFKTPAAEILRVRYVGEKHLFQIDGKEIELRSDDQPTLHAFVDGSVIEMIVGERIGVTKRFYYGDTKSPDVEVSISQPEPRLTAWRVRPISSNRLTTPATSA